MTNSAIVLMWPNADGTITLSQRRATAYAMPTVDRNPARVASVLADSSDVSMHESICIGLSLIMVETDCG